MGLCKRGPAHSVYHRLGLWAVGGRRGARSGGQDPEPDETPKGSSLAYRWTKGVSEGDSPGLSRSSANGTGKPGRPRLVPTPGVGLTQAVKQRRKGRVVGVEVRRVLGAPIECPYVVCEERLNGVLRDRLACLTRKTHAFAKAKRTWDAAVALCLFEINWLRPHQALREPGEGLPGGRRYRQRTPACYGDRPDGSYLELGGVPDVAVLSIL